MSSLAQLSESEYIVFALLLVLTVWLFFPDRKRSTFLSRSSFQQENQRGAECTLLYHTQLVENELESFEEIGRDIAEVATKFNQTVNVTGVLAVETVTGKALQVLEGPKDAVLYIFGNICKDPRHVIDTIIGPRAIDHRSFSEWGMIYADTKSYQMLKKLHPSIYEVELLDSGMMNSVFSQVSDNIKESQ